MSKIPEQLRYSETHEWIEDLGDGRYRMGITDHAQELLGDLVFVEIPQPGQTVTVGQACGVLESVKAASDLYSPLSGEVVESNTALSDNPQWINEDPYGQAWICIIAAAPEAAASLMDAQAYAQQADSH